jgi:hypothetical protein
MPPTPTGVAVDKVTPLVADAPVIATLDAAGPALLIVYWTVS